MRVQICIALVLFGLLGCREDEPTNFFARSDQTATERTVVWVERALDSLKLIDAEVFEPGWVAMSDESIYVVDYSSYKAAIFNKDDLSRKDDLSFGKGQGPGEVRGVQGFAVANGQVLIADENQRKIAIFDTSRAHVRDIRLEETYPSRLAALDDGFMMYATTSQGYLFNLIDREGNRVSGFEQVRLEDINPLSLTGYIASDGRHVYFAGYAEPLIKKYTVEGELIFSVTTVDDLPSEINYVTFETGEQTAWTFTDHALFSARDLAVSGDYLLVRPEHDVEGNRLRVLDAYSAEDGRYVRSYRLPGWPRKVVATEGRIYVIEFSDGEDYLKVYDNFLTDQPTASAEPSP